MVGVLTLPETNQEIKMFPGVPLSLDSDLITERLNLLGHCL